MKQGDPLVQLRPDCRLQEAEAGQSGDIETTRGNYSGVNQSNG